MPTTISRGTLRVGAARVCLLLAMLALPMSAPATATAGGDDLPDVHSSCESEDTQRSTHGDVQAQLTVINLTDSPFELFWLDYDGARVSYQESQPHSTQTQPTWVTHPWILADAQGTCYLLVVVNAVQKTMTIGTTTGETLVSLPPSTPSQSDAPDPADPDPDPASTPPAAGEESDPGIGFITPLVVAALAMMGVLVGVLLASGKLSVGGKGKP